MATPTPQMTITRDVIYKHEPDRDPPLDVYDPPATSPRSWTYHGGGCTTFYGSDPEPLKRHAIDRAGTRTWASHRIN